MRPLELLIEDPLLRLLRVGAQLLEAGEVKLVKWLLHGIGDDLRHRRELVETQLYPHLWPSSEPLRCVNRRLEERASSLLAGLEEPAAAERLRDLHQELEAQLNAERSLAQSWPLDYDPGHPFA